MKEKVVGLIPARMGSSRFPGKPITNINGFPMICWVYNEAKNLSEIDELYIVTPDIEIKNICDKFKMNCLFDEKQGNTAAQKLAFAAQELNGTIYLNIQGDEPLLDSNELKKIINEMLDNKDSYYVGLYSHIKNVEDFNNRNNVKVVLDNNGNALYFSRSPIPEKFEYGNANRVLGLYGYRDWFLEKFASIEKTQLESLESGIEMIRMLEYGYKIKLLYSEYNTLGVDLPSDIEKVEKEMIRRKGTK